MAPLQIEHDPFKILFSVIGKHPLYVLDNSQNTCNDHHKVLQVLPMLWHLEDYLSPFSV